MTDQETTSQLPTPCTTCGYDLRSHVASATEWAEVRCPECGHFPPVDPVRVCRNPGLWWHAVMAMSFGLPLVLTAFEAARQMVYRAGGAAVHAPSWLAFLDVGGLLGIVWGITSHAPFARDRTTFNARGIAFAATYFLLLCFLLPSIDWSRYRV